MTEEIIAKVVGLDLPISTKHTIEIADFIRGKSIQIARKQLQLVINKELAIPLQRFHKDRGHRKGEHIAQGFYPKKATEHIITLLNSLESNSKDKGMDANLLFISEIIPNTAAARWHSGRNRGKMKSTNLTIYAKEKKEKLKQEKKEEKPKVEKKEEKKKWLKDK